MIMFLKDNHVHFDVKIASKESIRRMVLKYLILSRIIAFSGVNKDFPNKACPII